MSQPVLHTARLTLRPPAARDWPQAKAFFTSPRAEALGGVFTEGKAWRTLAAEIGHWSMLGFGMWAVTRTGDDTCLGLIGPWCPVDWPETEIGWMIWDAGLEGTGIATEAARAAIAHAYGTLGWETVVHYIAPGNTRSIRLAEKLGAALDPDAPGPTAYPGTLVYRSPRPEGSA